MITPGALAYRAHNKALGAEAEMPAWGDLPVRVRLAWELTARVITRRTNGGKQLPSSDGTRVALVDGRDALAFVVFRPGTAGHVTVEASAQGLSKLAAAHLLRRVADLWEQEAAQQTTTGEEPPAQ